MYCAMAQVQRMTVKTAIEWDNLSLLNGNYFIDIDINDSDGNVQDTIHEAIDFTVEEQTGHTGIAQINAQWRF